MAAGRYDPSERRRSTRPKRYKGCRVYIPADELVAAGFDPDGPPPFYRTMGRPHSKNTGTVLVRLYREA